MHIVQLGAPGDITGGVLQVLNVGFRIPGFPVIHNNELQDGEILYNRGRALLLSGRLEEADSDFGAAMELNSLHPHFPHNKGFFSND